MGTFFSLSGAIGSAIAGICMRKMKDSVHFTLNPFWYSLGCVICSPLFHFI
jgi:hypothetical protein